MKKMPTGLIIGLLFLVVGVLYALTALDVFEFTIFFPGFWTLFIIIPCFYGLFQPGKDKTGYIIGLFIGICFLINAQDFSFHISFWPMIVAIICVVIGIKLIFPDRKNHDHVNVNINYDQQTGDKVVDVDVQGEKRSGNSFAHDSHGCLNATAVFGGKEILLDSEVFHGANLTSIFGGIDLDLRGAVIEEDVRINVSVAFGGIDLYVPNYVRVVTDGCTPILGGVDVKRPKTQYPDANTPTLYLVGTCIFGGIDIK